MDADTDDVRWLTYVELGQVRGISTSSATRLAFRRKWRRQPGNDGIARVAVPIAEAQPRTDKAPDDRDGDRGDITPIVSALEAAVSSLTERAETAEKRADRAENRADRAEARADRAERAIEVERNRAQAADLRADRAEQTLAGERSRADELRDRLDNLGTKLTDAQAELAAAQVEADAAAELRPALEIAQIAQGEAEADAAELRQAEAIRQGRGRWARLRQAWRGQ